MGIRTHQVTSKCSRQIMDHLATKVISILPHTDLDQQLVGNRCVLRRRVWRDPHVRVKETYSLPTGITQENGLCEPYIFYNTIHFSRISDGTILKRTIQYSKKYRSRIILSLQRLTVVTERHVRHSYLPIYYSFIPIDYY